MDDVSLPSVLCADLAMFPLPIFRFIEENCFRIVYDNIRNYGIIKKVSGLNFVAQNLEILGNFYRKKCQRNQSCFIEILYGHMHGETATKVTLQIAGLITEIGRGCLKTGKANMQISLS
jgi:hypothetical protein